MRNGEQYCRVFGGRETGKGHYGTDRGNIEPTVAMRRL